MKLRVAACQTLTYPDVARSADKIIHWLERAKEDGIDVVTFPEAGICGYQNDPVYWASADPDAFLAAEEAITNRASELDIAVVLGSAHWEGGQLFNSLLVIDKGGIVRGRYAKTHLAEDWPAPGRKLPIYDVAGVASCFIICHDVRYPELVRLPAVAGARICYFCSNESGFVKEFKLSAYNAMPIARATENSIFCVMANAPADLNDGRSVSQSHGNSKIIHPHGYVLDEAGFFEERFVTATIEVDDANRSIARRAAEDETILRSWMNEGIDLVDMPGSGRTEKK
jgi:predicted amidohydrolase